MTDAYTVRLMRRDELDLAVDWAAAEGWNPGLHDADAFYAADPQGFYVGVLDGEPIASISAVAYGDDFGFVGFYIVRPEYRGRGYGLRLWQQALQHLSGRNVGLDGVLAQQRDYERSGFQLAYRNVRFEGVAAPAPVVNPDVVELSSLPFETLLRYDSAHFPAPRPEFLRRWIALPGCAALGVLREGRLAGYGVSRACRAGYKLGPLFADDAATAEDLLGALAGRVEPGAPVYLDAPAANPAALALAQRHGMRPVGETVRMYTDAAPQLPLARIFGVTSLELG